MDERFAALADEFVTRVRAANIGPSTEVVLLYELSDVGGNPVPAVRVLLEPTTTVSWPGNPEAARRFAIAVHLDSIIGNINSLVRNASTDPIMLRGGPSIPVVVRGLSLEINQPEE